MYLYIFVLRPARPEPQLPAFCLVSVKKFVALGPFSFLWGSPPQSLTKMRSLPHKVIKRLLSVLIQPLGFLSAPEAALRRCACHHNLTTRGRQRATRAQHSNPAPDSEEWSPSPSSFPEIGKLHGPCGFTETNMSPLLDSSLVNSYFLLSQVWVENKTINLKSSTGEPKHYLCL